MVSYQTTTRPAKGKLVARRGRKARGLDHEIARLPGERTDAFVFLHSSPPNTGLKPHRISLYLAGTLASLTLAALGGPVLASAQAASTTCPTTTTSTPFSPWGDTSSYWLVPGGSFETSPTTWALSGAAGLIAGGDPFASAMTGKLGAWSLSIPTGSSAQSPFMCVEATERTYRFMAHSQGAEATIRPDLVYETSAGDVTVVGKKVTLKSSWEPSPTMHTGAMLVTAIHGESVHLALRFTALAGSAVINNVYIDPRMR